MFRNLVESGSHATDLKRRGSFFAGAVAFYAVLLTAAGIGSIYAINVRLDEREELELVTLMNAVPQPATVEPEARRPETRPAAGGDDRVQVARVTEVVKITPYAREVARTNAPVLPRNVPYVIGDINSVPADIGTVGPKTPGIPGDARRPVGPVVESDGEIAPPARVTPPKADPPKADPPRVVRLASSVISGKAINKPTPMYPSIAIQARVQGTVPVQILIDEQGRVVQAQATGGHPLLQRSAVEAAYKARFSPTLLSETPVKVSGVIYYNFVMK